MHGDDLYNVVRDRLTDLDPEPWPTWLDLTPEQREAWTRAEDDVYEQYVDVPFELQ